MKLLATVVAAFSLLTAAGAHATEDFCAVVLKPPAEVTRDRSYLAVADGLDGTSGQFYNGLRPARANPQAYDDTARERLRVLSLQLTGLA